jgi:hypothetical protein
MKWLVAGVCLAVGLASPAGPAQAATYSLDGWVSSSNGDVSSGSVVFFENCQKFADNAATASATIDDGYYEIVVPAGTYRVLINPGWNTHAAKSWHAEMPTCEQATPVTVTGDASVDLLAMPLHEVTGIAKTAAGPVPFGTIRAYANCADYRTGVTNSIGSSGIFPDGTGGYSLELPVGTYRIFLMGPSRSWHDAKATCEEATEVTVTAPMDLDLVGLPPLTVTGSVSSANGAITQASVWFFRSCQDQRPNNNDYAVAGWMLEGGKFKVMLPAGTYRVRIDVFPGQHARPSWHSAKTSCEDASEFVVTESGTRDLTAAAESTLSGSVRSKRGPIQSGTLQFYSDCQAEPVASTEIQAGTYKFALLNGTYRVFIRPFSGYGYQSWHSAQPTCAKAAQISVTGDATVNLMPLTNVQRVKRPPQRIKRGKQIRLAKVTNRGTAVTWTSATRKICKVRKSTLTGTKVGRCKISAQSQPRLDLVTYTKTFRIRVVKN